jgi:hypothetical protein
MASAIVLLTQLFTHSYVYSTVTDRGCCDTIQCVLILRSDNLLAQSTFDSEKALSLAPLGAGDLIDRAIRLYRREFLTLLRIAALPVLVSATGSVMSTIGWQGFSITSSTLSMVGYGLMLFVGIVLAWSGLLFQVIVMGGATRNLITHLLWNEPVSAKATYRNVRMRFWGLLGVSLVLVVCASFSAVVTLVVFYVAVIMLVLGFVAISLIFPSWVAGVVFVIALVIVCLALVAVFFFLMGHVAYMPQVMLVEGKGVFESISRSFRLARGHVRRLMAMAVFSWLAAYSALMVMVVPLGIYAYLNGINPVSFSGASTPAWYSIGYTVIGQVSSIIIAPIWMLGLSLLYVDQRVRHEGYDIEIMAARQLGEMPALPVNADSAYNPAIASQREEFQGINHAS